MCWEWLRCHGILAQARLSHNLAGDAEPNTLRGVGAAGQTCTTNAAPMKKHWRSGGKIVNNS
jgi:hypothetical protein